MGEGAGGPLGALIAGIERLDELGLDGIEPAVTFMAERRGS